MVQHVLLAGVVPPLAVAAHPWRALRNGLPRRLARAPLLRALRRGAAGAAAGRLAAGGEAIAVASHAAALALFHVPPVYDAAVDRAWLHALEHASFVLTGGAFWAAVSRRRAGPVARLGAPFALALASTALGALLLVAGRPLYRLGASHADPAGRLADQQVAGVVMWAYGGLLTGACALHRFVTWLAEAERRAPATPAP